MIDIQEGKVVIIADIHQRIGYVERVLSQEPNADKYVFLGDWFDTFYTPDNKEIYGVQKTCEYINEKLDDDRFIWLIGNHDLSYISTYNSKTYVAKPSFYCCSGWTRSKANSFNKYINAKFFEKLKLCCKVGNFVCSHAGFHIKHFKPYKSELENIQDLYNQWEEEKFSFMHQAFHWIDYAGVHRGGEHEVGSPVWQDYYFEFQPLEDISQIVGHTNHPNNPTIKKSLTGLENYCIDNEQQYYGVWGNNKLTIKRVSTIPI